MEMFRFQFWYFQLKTVLQFFEKVLRFWENLFQSWSIENVQNFQWLRHTNMPISQTEGLFKKSLVPFIRRTYTLSLGLKMKPLRKRAFFFKTKTNSNFLVNPVECWKRQPFISVYLKIHIFQISVLFKMWQWNV